RPCRASSAQSVLVRPVWLWSFGDLLHRRQRRNRAEGDGLGGVFPLGPIGFGDMTDVTAGQGPRSRERSGLFHNWRYVLATTIPPPGRLDPVSKWLYLTRAGVLPMTLVAAALAGLLAVYRDASVAWGWFALAAVGIVLAHMANNLMND